MDYERYRWECLQRNPEFQRDVVQLLEAFPGVVRGRFGPSGSWIGPEGEKEALARFAEERARFEEKYPLVTFDYVFMVRHSAPLLYDPAWAVARSQAALEYLTKHGGQAPPSDDAVAEGTREIYMKMDSVAKTAVRCTPGHAIFEIARIFLPIGPSTRLEHVRKLWRLIRRQQELCYGPAVVRNVKRERRSSQRYEQRLTVWDDVEVRKKPIKKIAKTLGKSIWTVYRLYYEAVRDIDPARLEVLRTPEGMRTHVRLCATCSDAERSGRSDDYCGWMQRQLGARSGRISNTVSLEGLVEGRQEGREGLHESPDGDEHLRT